LALYEDFTVISRRDTGNSFDKSRFSGAIVADKTYDFIRVDLKIDIR
jgi:hypothetical protein